MLIFIGVFNGLDIELYPNSVLITLLTITTFNDNRTVSDYHHGLVPKQQQGIEFV